MSDDRRLLLDTCAFIWIVLAPDNLSEAARRGVSDKQAEIHVSAISCAEVACAVQKGRLQLESHWKPWFRRFVELNAWTVLPIDMPVVEEAYSLPGELHNDPADRLIVASARIHGLHVVTSDRKIIDYPHVNSLW